MDWSTAEELTLDDLITKRWGLQRIADHMGRTLDSVRTKAHKMKRARLGLPRYGSKRAQPSTDAKASRRVPLPRDMLKSAPESDLVDELIERGWTCYPPNRRKR
jgi:hypothetical protein